MSKTSPNVNPSPQIGNPDDKIRDSILRHLFEVHRTAKGPNKAAIGIRDLQTALKTSVGYKQAEVTRNLDYLVQKGWVREVVRERKFQTPGGTIQSAEQTKYKISDVGIDKIQKASLFQRSTAPTGINITNINGVTIVGDGNVVNTRYTDLSRVLTEMKIAVQAAPNLGDEQKLETLADIESLQVQLQKPHPNRSVVNTLWRSVENTITAAGFLELLHQATQLLSPLIGEAS